MIVIDTNLLVHAHRASTPEHRAARRAIERAATDPRGWGVAATCIAEFWSAVTHPSAAGAERIDVRLERGEGDEDLRMGGRPAIDELGRCGARLGARGLRHLGTFNAGSFSELMALDALSPRDIVLADLDEDESVDTLCGARCLETLPESLDEPALADTRVASDQDRALGARGTHD